jgi:hypothetical protein
MRCSPFPVPFSLWRRPPTSARRGLVQSASARPKAPPFARLKDEITRCSVVRSRKRFTTATEYLARRPPDVRRRRSARYRPACCQLHPGVGWLRAGAAVLDDRAAHDLRAAARVGLPLQEGSVLSVRAGRRRRPAPRLSAGIASPGPGGVGPTDRDRRHTLVPHLGSPWPLVQLAGRDRFRRGRVG